MRLLDIYHKELDEAVPLVLGTTELSMHTFMDDLPIVLELQTDGGLFFKHDSDFVRAMRL